MVSTSIICDVNERVPYHIFARAFFIVVVVVVVAGAPYWFTQYGKGKWTGNLSKMVKIHLGFLLQRRANRPGSDRGALLFMRRVGMGGGKTKRRDAWREELAALFTLEALMN